MTRRARILLAGAFLAWPAVAGAALIETYDLADYTVRVRGQEFATESVVIEAQADSVVCKAESHYPRRTDKGEEPVDKTMLVVFGRSDWALRYYQSNETFRGQTLVRGVVGDPSDTAMTVFKETREGRGEAMRMVAPPGRTFLLDSGLYSLFDLICIYLKGRTFTTRPLNLLTFGVRDTIVEAEVSNLGTKSIQWGGRARSARHYRLSDGTTVFEMWANDAGQMLRLVHEPSGLVVERRPPARRPAAPKPKPGG